MLEVTNGMKKFSSHLCGFEYIALHERFLLLIQVDPFIHC